jgi:hypothetical protein
VRVVSVGPSRFGAFGDFADADADEVGAGVQALTAWAALDGLDGLDAGARCWPAVGAHAASVISAIANVVSAAIRSIGVARRLRQMRRVALLPLCIDRIEIISRL